MRNATGFAVLGVLLCAGWLTAQSDGDGKRLPAEKFDQIFSLVKASPGEARWDEIPWIMSLWDARMKAAAEGKPLFIWAANGNPLGIT